MKWYNVWSWLYSGSVRGCGGGCVDAVHLGGIGSWGTWSSSPLSPTPGVIMQDAGGVGTELKVSRWLRPSGQELFTIRVAHHVLRYTASSPPCSRFPYVRAQGLPTSGHCGLMTRWPLEAHCVCLRKCFTEILPFSSAQDPEGIDILFSKMAMFAS